LKLPANTIPRSGVAYGFLLLFCKTGFRLKPWMTKRNIRGVCQSRSADYKPFQNLQSGSRSRRIEEDNHSNSQLFRGLASSIQHSLSGRSFSEVGRLCL